MTSIGETLKRERLRRGWNLEQVSRETKISSRLLEYIESEQFDKLPGGVFTRSFVRQYASTLGLDGDEIASELQRQIHIEPEPALPGPETTYSSLAASPLRPEPRTTIRKPPSLIPS